MKVLFDTSKLPHLTMEIENTKEMSDEVRNASRGFGLENAMKRLDLIYPEKHKLTIDEGKERYRVRLEIDLSLS